MSEETRDGMRARRLRTALGSGLAIALLAMLVVAASTALAAARGWIGHGGHAGDLAAFRAEWLLRGVDATPEQQGKVRDIVEELVADLGASHADHGSVHEALVAELSAETPDRDALEALRAEQIAALDAASRRVLDALLAAADVLSPEQRAELAEQAARFGPRRHGWHGGAGRRWGAGHPHP